MERVEDTLFQFPSNGKVHLDSVATQHTRGSFMSFNSLQTGRYIWTWGRELLQQWSYSRFNSLQTGRYIWTGWWIVPLC